MKIRISTLPPEGLTITESLPLSSLNDRLQEGHESDIRFSSAPQVSLQISPSADGATASGSVRAMVKQPCSRCVEVIERELEVEANFVIQARNPRETNPRDTEQDDIGIVYYDGEHVDLEDTLQQYLLLNLSPFWHPPFAKDGSCLHCGKNFEEPAVTKERGSTVQLGDLLKKAGVKASK